MEESSAKSPILISEIHLQNLLSFGPDAKPIPLGPLNVLIGANGSGKSNLIEAIGLIKAMAGDLRKVISKGGGVEEWIWKGAPDESATLNFKMNVESPYASIGHSIKFKASNHFLQIEQEAIIGQKPGQEDTVLYQNAGETGQFLSKANRIERFQRKDLKSDQSVASQAGFFNETPAFNSFLSNYSSIAIYREWHFGRNADYRRPVAADMPSDFLEENLNNLGLFLNRILSYPKVKVRFLGLLRDLYDGLTDIHFAVIGGSVQVNLIEEEFTIPATRLSDGTLHYLCLLAILLDPTPPMLICIEEPELGMHPDLIHKIADLMVEASERTQLIITTHSGNLLDSLGDRPDAVIVFEKFNGKTEIEHPDPKWLAGWMESYSLGQVWSKNLIGGNRW